MNCGYITSKQNKTRTKKQTKKITVVGLDQFCWGARAKMNVLKSLKQLLWSSTDELYP